MSSVYDVPPTFESLYNEAKKMLDANGFVKISGIQRRLRISYMKAAKVVEKLIENGEIESEATIKDDRFGYHKKQARAK